MIKKILVSIGGTPYTPIAVERAILIAARFDAQITGLVEYSIVHCLSG